MDKTKSWHLFLCWHYDRVLEGVREKTEVPVKILVNSTRETNILARENFYKNVPVKSQKCA